MQRNLVRNLLFIGIALLLLGTSLTVVRIVMVHADANQRFTLSNQTVPLLSHAQVLQAADTNQQLNLSISLQLRDSVALDALLSALYDPQSPRYHQYLTPDQFTQLFAPTSDQVQQVITYLQSQGLTVTGVAPNNLLIDATGSVRQVQQSFHVQINHYQLGKRTFYANANPPSIPAAVSQLIASIGGLDNTLQYQPLYQRLVTQHTSIHGHAHASAGPAGLGPKDLAGAYDLTPLQSNGTLGDNQSIALFELDGYQQSDLAPFFQNYGISMPNITNVLVDGFSGSAGSGAIEDELDIEVVGAMAPHANIFVYEGPNTTQGINDTYTKIVTDNKVQVTSISWGLCETSSGNAELQTLDTIFKQGVAEGITFVAASGDSGAYDCQDTNLGVDSPASDPYVTGVGATSLQMNNGAYGTESVWSNAAQTQRGPKGAGSGGGISNTFLQPNWQGGVGVSQYGSGNRKVPDVAATGDPTNGYNIYCTVTNAGCPPSGWMQVGGTSAAAPLWASSLVLVNQYLQAHNKTVLGLANPALYALFNNSQQYPSFHDVTTGANLFYQATVGYDVASGLGSPDVYNIARDLLSLSVGGTPTPTPSPTSTPTPTPTPNPTPVPPSSLIKNGDFENGQSPWQESSSQGYQMIDTSNAYTGQYSVYFCGYTGCDDRIWQSFTVPTSFTKITVSYWWYSDTNKTTKQCLDTFDSRLQDSSGSTTILNMQHSCNTNATNAWVLENFDASKQLSAYKGKAVNLFFRGTNAQNQYQTSDFFVDAVTITVS
jgi:kumamolisin